MRNVLLIGAIMCVVPAVVAGQYIPEGDAPLRYDPVTRTYSLRTSEVGQDGRKREVTVSWESKSQFEASVDTRVQVGATGVFRYSYRLHNLRTSRQAVAVMFLPDIGRLMVKDGRGGCLEESLPTGHVVLSNEPGLPRSALCVDATARDFRMTLIRSPKDAVRSMLTMGGGQGEGWVLPGSSFGPVTLSSSALPMLQRAGLEGRTSSALAVGELDGEERRQVDRWWDEDMVWASVIAPGFPRPNPYVRSGVVSAIVSDVRRWGERKLPEGVRSEELARLIESAGRAEGAAFGAALSDFVQRAEAMPEVSPNARHLITVYAQLIREAPVK